MVLRRKNTCLERSSILSDFIPPVVDPAIPQVMPTKTSITEGRKGHVLLSPIPNPLVEA